LDEAEAVYRETIELFPDDAVARSGLADVLKDLGRLDEAEAVYRETIELFPDDAVARSGLADVLKDLGRLDEAETAYREVLELFSHDPKVLVVAHTGLAGVLRAQGRLQDALEQTDAALALESNNTFALAERQRILQAERGQPSSRAARHLPQMKSVASLVAGPMSRTKRRVLLCRVVWLRRQANAGASSVAASASPDDLRSRAAEILTAILQQYPDDERTLAQQCLLLLDTGDLDAAAQQVDAALRVRPNAQLLLTLRARVDRLRARRDQERLQPDVEPRVLEAPRQLRRFRPELRPVVLLQQGLGYLALTDGELRNEKVAEEFGKLHRWIEHRLDPQARDNASAKADEEEDDRSFSEREAGVDAHFNRWWAEELKRNVFELVTEAGAPEPADVPRLATVLEDKNQLVEKLEDFYVGRLAARAEWDPTEPVAA
jgi:tetratricopeptide (TPR) repeat protein